MDLGFEEPAAVFESGSQNARIWTEGWVHARLYCPNCAAPRIERYPANRAAADFYCARCREDFELKAQRPRFGRKVLDGAFGTMCERLASDTSPSLMLMRYDKARLSVTDFFVVPRQFFVREVIEERPPLGPHARRAGWVGCKILLGDIPDAGKVWFVRESQALPQAEVLHAWRRTAFLQRARGEARGWLIEVMKSVEAIGAAAFTLDDVYAHEARLSTLYPGNRHVRPKIRQQLQVLRDQGFLQFTGRGRYRLSGSP
jgi:type II restriction enzyme